MSFAKNFGSKYGKKFLKEFQLFKGISKEFQLLKELETQHLNLIKVNMEKFLKIKEVNLEK